MGDSQTLVYITICLLWSDHSYYKASIDCAAIRQSFLRVHLFNFFASFYTFMRDTFLSSNLQMRHPAWKRVLLILLIPAGCSIILYLRKKGKTKLQTTACFDKIPNSIISGGLVSLLSRLKEEKTNIWASMALCWGGKWYLLGAVHKWRHHRRGRGGDKPKGDEWWHDDVIYEQPLMHTFCVQIYLQALSQ